jgi:mannose-6-phosphate isomerase-like protein (cupin superfamily)
MSIPPGGDIEREVHPNSDQFIRFEAGSVEVALYESLTSSQPLQIKRGGDGFSVVIPSGRYHYVRNIGDVDLKLYALYMPPFHPSPYGLAVSESEIAQLEGRSITYVPIRK